MERTSLREHPLETVRAIRERKKLIKAAEAALARDDFPDGYRVPLQVVLDRAETLSPYWFATSVARLLETARKVWKAAKEEKEKARLEYRLAAKRREALKRRLQKDELSNEDAGDVEIMIDMLERHLKCVKGEDPPKAEKDLVLAPGDFLKFTERYVHRFYVPVPAVQTQGRPAAAQTA